MNNFERAIQKSVIRWVIETYPNIIITGTDNENNYKDVESIGSLGITDIVLFNMINGNVLFLELKCSGNGAAKKGTLKPSQIKWNKKFDSLHPDNFSRAVGYGYLEAQEIIKTWIDNSPSA